jgi:glutathione-independent formaldehyde dehydrogenase
MRRPSSPQKEWSELIHIGKAHPSFIISHELPLERAPEGYQHFDSRDNGWTKVTLAP